LAAVALADLSLHVDRGGLLVAGTAVFALLAITANGPLGLVRVVPRRLHVYAVCVVAVVFALAPILPQIRPDASGIIIIEFGAVGLFRLATLTSTVVTVRAPRGAARAAPATNQPATNQPATNQPATNQPATGQPATGQPATGQPANRPPATGQPGVPTSALGAASATGSTSAPDPSTGAGAAPRSATEKVSSTETAGRWIGRQASAAAQHAGIAAEAAALTAEKHAPAARAQAGRAVRSAGRLTGRLTRSVSSNPSGSAGPSGPTPTADEPSETTDIQGPEDPK
ncbi:MAG TPA: hypothetical protein VG226_04555, partial [Acidimicrobiales bacterium]|nr:hypothetical protein [Acidimicrobiales bacterium]